MQCAAAFQTPPAEGETQHMNVVTILINGWTAVICYLQAGGGWSVGLFYRTAASDWMEGQVDVET